MLSERLKTAIKDYPNFPKEGILFKDLSPVLSDPILFSELISKMSKNLYLNQCDAIIAIDARGFIYASAIAHTIKKPMILARKKNKLPGKVIQESYGLEYGQDCIEIQEDAIKNFKTFVIVDDLLATGGTVSSVSKILQREQKTILALSVVIELSELNGSKMFNFPVFSEVIF